MKIHSDILTEQDLYEAIGHSGIVGVWLHVEPEGSRSRKYGYKVGLESDGSLGRTRRRNNGTSDTTSGGFAASWEDWGYWLGVLFRKDPEMHCNYYKGLFDFNEKTKWEFS